MEYRYIITNLTQLIVCVLLLNFLINNSYAESTNKPITCTQEYVLCTSAACVPDPRNPQYAICSCVVKNGLSIGFKSCENRKPKNNKYKVKQLVSTFSFAQFDSKKGMACSKGSPWTDCLDAPCTVNPMSPEQAICSCKIHQQESFLTLGGDCNAGTCSTGFWSGATLPNSTLLRNALFEKLNITTNPWPNSDCPISKS